MATPTQTLVEQFRQDIGDVVSTTDENQLRIKSSDFHWYSPVLTPLLQNCRADIVVQPRSEQEIESVAAAAAKRRLPITLRGGGTGNYGQAVPLQGGIVLDMTRYDKVIVVKPGSIHVQAGAVVLTVLEAALATGQQLMMYPSTMKSATIGGYLGGWWDEVVSFVGNVLLSFPVMVLFVLVLNVLGQSGFNIIIAVTCSSAPMIRSSRPRRASRSSARCATRRSTGR